MMIIIVQFIFLGLFFSCSGQNDSDSGPKHIYAREHKLLFNCFHPLSNLAQTCCPPGGGGNRYIKKVGMLVENFEIDP